MRRLETSNPGRVVYRIVFADEVVSPRDASAVRVADGHLVLILTPIVVAEVAYAARTLFQWRRGEITERLTAFLSADGLMVREASQVSLALSLLGTHRIDFADAYLAAVASDPGPPIVASFDRDFEGIDGLRRLSA